MAKEMSSNAILEYVDCWFGAKIGRPAFTERTKSGWFSASGQVYASRTNAHHQRYKAAGNLPSIHRT